MEDSLRAAFNPRHLRIRDDSHHHAGHSGARPEGETHFYVEIAAESLDGKPRVAQQRAVYAALSAEMAGPIHALQLKIVD